MEQRKERIRFTIAYVLMVLLLLLLVMWNITSGSVDLSFGEIAKVLGAFFSGAGLGGSGNGGQNLSQYGLEGNLVTAYSVIWNIRMPRLLAALFLGGALSVSGFLLQTFFGNPIAGPYVLGISSGAKLVVALVMINVLGRGLAITSWQMVIAAFVGSMLAMGFVLLLSTRVRNMSFLVVCGIMIGYICSAITDFCITFANDSNIVNLHNWSLGSFSGMDWNDVRIFTFLVAVTVVLSFCLAKPISAYQMGESYARNMGVNVTFLRVALILLSSLLSACVTAFAGPISFVGIAVPHLVKTATGTAKPLILIPGCFLGGAVITLFCDGIARTVFAPTEISISSVTAIFLVPVVIYMMVKKQGRRA